MFITTKRYKADLAELQARLAKQTARVFELEARAAQAERTAHVFAEEARYTLEAAAIAVHGDNINNDLGAIAGALPYLYSGRRHWDEKADPGVAADAKRAARMIAQEHGFELPSDPVEAVKSMLELSSMLLVPSFSLPVQGLKVRYPIRQIQI